MSDVLFTAPGVERYFIACASCGRTVPHYQVYGKKAHVRGLCTCGGSTFKPRTLSVVAAAWWLLVVGWMWRKTIRKQKEWDPRMPIRTVA